MEIDVRRSRRPRRAIRTLTTLVSLAATLAGVALMLPTAFGMQRYVITGESMTGTIDLGSLVFEEVVPVSQLQVGDIITYQPPPGSNVTTMVTHRIVSIHGDVFRTKGDAVPQRDPWKFRLDRAEQPRVKYAVPYVGWLFIWLADRSTRMVAIGIPAGLICLASLGQFAAAVRERRRERRSDRRDIPPTSLPASG